MQDLCVCSRKGDRKMHEFLLPHDHGNKTDSTKLREFLSYQAKFQGAAALFKMLDDESRIRIFWLLCHSEECAANIAALTDMSGPAASHHLKLLRSAGLIDKRRAGKETYYRAADTELSLLLHEALEKVMRIACPDDAGADDPAEIIREIHHYLNEHLDQKITIDALSLKFHLNTTTLKKVFKQVYGTSVAAHIRMHRMEKAAELLTTTEDSVLAIAQAVGYESQSRFTCAFKEQYGMQPTEYRKGKKEPDAR